MLLLGTVVAALGLGGWLALAPADEAPADEAPADPPPQVLTPPGPDLPDASGRDDMEAGRSLVERGAELFLRGLLDEMGPQIDEMQKGLGTAAETLGPKLRQILALIDDVRNYQPPERLENGDIVLRRVPGAPAPPALPETSPEPAPPAPVTDL